MAPNCAWSALRSPPPALRIVAPPLLRFLRAVVGALICVLGFAPAALRAQAEAPPPQGTILVLAASSLGDALPAVARLWEAQGGTPVRFSFAATSRLAPLALQGDADLFVSADQEWMDWVVKGGGADAEDVVSLLGNALVVAVPAGRGDRPRTLADLVSVPRIALAGEAVPAGRYARTALEAAGLWEGVASRVVRGESVRGALEWVARGEADAGIVYRTDVPVTPGVEVAFEVPRELTPPIAYPGVVLSGAPHARDAAAFLAFLRTRPATEVFAAAGFEPPPLGFGTSAPPPVAAPADASSAILLSLLVALAATAIGLVPSLALGRLLARREFPAKPLVSTIVLMPLVLPPVVTGFILLRVFGARGWLGPALGALGITVPFTVLAPVIAAVVVGLPFYVLSARAAFEAVDPRLEEVAWTLGVKPRATFRRIVLPLASPGIAAGAVLAFARALGEFGATIVLAGNVEGRTRTIPLAVYSLLESPAGSRGAWILAGVSVTLSLLALVGFELLARAQKKKLEEWSQR